MSANICLTTINNNTKLLQNTNSIPHTLQQTAELDKYLQQAMLKTKQIKNWHVSSQLWHLPFTSELCFSANTGRKYKPMLPYPLQQMFRSIDCNGPLWLNQACTTPKKQSLTNPNVPYPLSCLLPLHSNFPCMFWLACPWLPQPNTRDLLVPHRLESAWDTGRRH